MDSNQIEQYLQALNVKIGQSSTSRMNIVLLGGALMVTQLRVRPSTQDIDVVLATSNAQDYQNFKQAISLVAQEQGIAQDWMNDDVTLIVDQVGKPKIPKLWKSYTHLDIYVPEFEYVLALKLFAARLQDDRDIKALAKQLHLSTQVQAWAIIKTYIPPMQLSKRYIEAEKAIQRCFT